MKFAYLINAHKNAKQVLRLINQLNNDRTDFVIHVSKTCEIGFWSEIKKLTKSYDNVFFCKREKSIHGGFAIVQATVNGMETLLKAGSKFDYLHLLSGQDYPLKKNADIFDFFENNSGKEYIKLWEMFPEEETDDFKNHPWGDHRQSFRVDRFSFPWMGGVLIIPELGSRRLLDKNLYLTIKIFIYEFNSYRKKGTIKEEFWCLFFSRLLPEKRIFDLDFTLYGGKTWFSFTRALIEHIVQEHNNNPKWKRFYKYTLIPDEMYFHTIAMDSKFSKNIVNDYLREVDWKGGDGTHPIFWGKADFNRLKGSKNFWARKFDNEVDGEILNLIDEDILNC